MPDLSRSVSDLSTYTESTRRTLYDRVVEFQFTPHTAEHPEDAWTPTYSPEDAGLQVFRAFGCWFATWTDLDASPKLPEDRRVELVRVQADRIPRTASGSTRSEPWASNANRTWPPKGA